VFKAYVAANEARAVGELRAMFAVEQMDTMTRVMRQRVLNAIAQIGSDALQALLCEMFAEEERDEEHRIDALFALPYCMWPSEATIDAMRALLPERAAEPSEFGKSVALVFGTVADTLHESGQAERARAARFELYYLLFSARRRTSATCTTPRSRTRWASASRRRTTLRGPSRRSCCD
jgi:hypothetical protein